MTKRCVGLRLFLPGRRLSWLIEFSLSLVEDGRSSSCPSLCFLLEFIPRNHVPLPITRSCLPFSFKQRFNPWALSLSTETLHTTLTQSALNVTSPLSNDWGSCLLFIGSGQLETHLGPSSADLTLQSLSSASIPNSTTLRSVPEQPALNCLFCLCTVNRSRSLTRFLYHDRPISDSSRTYSPSHGDPSL